ncbi:protein MIZU-KUSSEI 1 [Humulus lupulus]|uniref:protein MIZU-KUSSEI 1 n=1 Tax=Humulus lupulus TaxID=3486 RepID=UPI002B41171B|nr:protein MIZU-KUSSEI 1 [Humulus lupulus]
MAVDHQQQQPQPPLSSPHRHRPPISLQPSHKSSSRPPSKPAKLLRRVRSVFRSFPIITPASCKMPGSLQGITRHHGGMDGHIHGGTRMTGTLFGFRKARVNLALQENPRCLPSLVLELAIPTGKLLQDMGTGMVRIALECERHPSEKTRIAQEPIWALYCNGRKSGYAVRREATEDDLVVMQLLNAVSMGAGVLPTDHAHDHQDGELTYMRAFFERVVGSRDSETYHMMSPDQSSHNGTTELSIFFVRI